MIYWNGDRLQDDFEIGWSKFCCHYDEVKDSGAHAGSDRESKHSVVKLTMMSGREGKGMGGKHYEMPGYRENYSEPIAYEQKLLAVAEQRLTAALRNVRDWKAFRSFFNSEYCWRGTDQRRWKEMMN